MTTLIFRGIQKNSTNTMFLGAHSHQRSLWHGQGGCTGSTPTAAPPHCTQTHQRSGHCEAHEATCPCPEGVGSLYFTVCHLPTVYIIPSELPHYIFSRAHQPNLFHKLVQTTSDLLSLLYEFHITQILSKTTFVYPKKSEPTHLSRGEGRSDQRNKSLGVTLEDVPAVLEAAHLHLTGAQSHT